MQWENMDKDRLSKIWDRKYPIHRNFRWRREDGSYCDPKDMNLFHLFHALMLVWNHGVPEDYMMPPYRIYKFAITRKQRRFMISNLINALLNRRGEISKDQWNRLVLIMEWVGSTKRKTVPKQLW